MHWLEKWLMPPTCVISGRASENLDLHADYVQAWRINHPICSRCAEPSANGLLCGRCLKQPPAFYRSQIGFRFDNELRELIHQYKYQRHLYMSRLLVDAWLPFLDTVQVERLIPIPLHPQRLHQRGYNQSLELARMLSKRTGIPVANLLIRHETQASQTQLNAKQRVQNLRRAFSLAPGQLQDLRHVALIDDVMTTGATMQAAAQCLHRQAPQLQIQAWAVAKPYQ